MVQVATGGASHEMLPVLLLVPRLQGPPSAYSMLGYGDVVLPGLLLVYLRIFDVQHRRRGLRGYLPPAAVGYATGLLLTYGALYLSLGGDQGQPALLYLVPCTLGLSLVLARLRGDLGAMWAGSAPDPKAADPLDLAASPGAPERGTLLARAALLVVAGVLLLANRAAPAGGALRRPLRSPGWRSSAAPPGGGASRADCPKPGSPVFVVTQPGGGMGLAIRVAPDPNTGAQGSHPATARPMLEAASSGEESRNGGRKKVL
ncbi:hypothetical protein WJX81_006352 [Elliptochloris bilobata]|uniref:Uncharacterized protein n=1 Tax=Elliptochloris bilobata TaxID=381761 RepID=A0AAW1PYR2_9CHLO